jgi:hypothetical protein
MSAPWPNSYPYAQPGFDFNFDAFFAGVQASIQASRQSLNQAPLVPKGEILVGQEQLSEHYDAPAITVVPRGFRYVPARNFSQSLIVRHIWSWWLDLEVHCWGDDDPQGISQLYSFSSATELARQFLAALALAAGGPARVQPGSSEWVQHTDVNRRGRKLVCRPSFERHVNADAPLPLPLATSTTPGVTFSFAAQETSPDGSSTVTQAIFTVP